VRERDKQGLSVTMMDAREEGIDLRSRGAMGIRREGSGGWMDRWRLFSGRTSVRVFWLTDWTVGRLAGWMHSLSGSTHHALRYVVTHNIYHHDSRTHKYIFIPSPSHPPLRRVCRAVWRRVVAPLLQSVCRTCVYVNVWMWERQGRYDSGYQ